MHSQVQFILNVFFFLFCSQSKLFVLKYSLVIYNLNDLMFFFFVSILQAWSEE